MWTLGQFCEAQIASADSRQKIIPALSITLSLCRVNKMYPFSLPLELLYTYAERLRFAQKARGSLGAEFLFQSTVVSAAATTTLPRATATNYRTGAALVISLVKPKPFSTHPLRCVACFRQQVQGYCDDIILFNKTAHDRRRVIIRHTRSDKSTSVTRGSHDC